ncbi:glycosyltransferase family 2 protein [Sphingomonas sp. LY160]|uniref:glycosyltransferase family 2 protein n=1 Tax=Sphingomonas sp. LY160 TaxID=3095342 RepID=UPI002ADED63A|nr:glycosyltransferase family 2 protein [Sphingomonas sp. LY160]MEA1072530.1 glycosyltransferase family 2 protein [Sphingomonas sp. LY160]
MSPLELTLVVPVKDEEAAIGQFLTRVIPVLEGVADPAAQSFEILFIDDGSSDTTLEVIRKAHAADPRVRGLSLSRNFGKEAALSAGLDAARGKSVVPLDVDLQDPPDVLPAMIAKWREGYDVVYGVRDNRETDTLPKRLTADLYYRAHNWLSQDKIPEHAGDFRLLDRRVVDVIRAMPERNRFMKGLFAWAGFRQAAVSYHREERKVGKTKYNYWKLWTLAIDGITSASTVPLRIWSYLGAFVALGALGYAVFIVIRTLMSGVDLPGYASMMVAVLFLGGLQLLSLGVLGEYVGRILIETKGRPLYVVREKIGAD